MAVHPFGRVSHVDEYRGAVSHQQPVVGNEDVGFGVPRIRNPRFRKLEIARLALARPSLANVSSCQSLDWSVIGGTGALYTPFFAQCSYFAGLAFNLWLVTPILYFSNFWDAQKYDSPVGAHLYNSTFGRFDVKEILNPDLSLNEAAYDRLGPLRLAPYFALSYGISFAILMSAITSVLIWHSGDIKKAFTARSGEGDVHIKLLERNYLNVPRS